MSDWDSCARRLRAGLDALGQSPEAGQVERLLAYLQALTRWNATYNLTAVREPAVMVSRHLLDCLAIGEFVIGGRLADVGSGPGLPGLVLAITRPGLAVTLVESNRKKAAFLRHVRRELALANVEIEQVRVEAYAPAQPFDCVTTRAFATAGDTLRNARHLLAPGGRLVLMKGRDPAAELAALPAGLRHVQTVPLAVPELREARHVVLIEPD